RPHRTSNEEIWNLRDLVERNLADARVEEVSLDNRLGSLFRAALTLCTMALYASGYRIKATKAHHEYTIRSLALTLGEEWNSTVDIFNQARVTRGRLDYESVGTATCAE